MPQATSAPISVTQLPNLGLAKYTIQEWREIVCDMADRSGLKEEEQQEIQAYLNAARQAL